MPNIQRHVPFPPIDRLGVKICGFTSALNTGACIAAGAETLGFNFWPRSKRYLAPHEAGWLTALPDAVTRVGVFVNAAADDIAEIYERGLIHIAQLHGDESPEFGAELSSKGIPVIKAIAVRDGDSLKRIREFPQAVAILLDAYLPGEYGGGGTPFDWTLARRAVAENPEFPIILSGGLTPENAAASVAAVSPAAIDLASGVESAPGVKDPVAVSRLLRNLGLC